MVVLSLHVQKVQHFFLTPFFLSSNAAMMSFLAKVPGNKSKIERVFHKQKKSENSVSAMHAQRIMKGIQEAEAKLRAKHAPLKRELDTAAIQDAINNIISVIEFRMGICPNTIDLTTSDTVDLTIVDGDGTSDASSHDAIAHCNTTTTPAVKGGSIMNQFTWNDRAIGVFLFLHPLIYGQGPINKRLSHVSAAIGANENTIRQWISLSDKTSDLFIPIWYPIVKQLKWSYVKTRFQSEWANQFKIADDSMVVDKLAPYREKAKKSQMVVIIKDTNKSNAKSRKKAAKKDNNIKHIRLGNRNDVTKRKGRNDCGKSRAYKIQAKAVEQFVQERWNSGDPATRNEVYDMLRIRDDCAQDTEFFKSMFSSGKQSCLSNFVTRCLDRIHFTVRKNSIGQKVPVNWRELALADSTKIKQVFKEAQVDIVINSDQTFIRFFPEMEFVLAPSGAKRVGGKINTNEKSGFTVMVSCELNSSTMLDPFIVFDGTKKQDAKDLHRTKWWKYRNWRMDAPGRSAKVTFHPKHWFDEDITIEFLEFVLQLYPNKKVGIIWDAAGCHGTAKVLAFITQHQDRLVVVGISGGITSVIQVCDLVANKILKQLIRDSYYLWRTAHIRDVKSEILAKGGSPNNERIKVKMPINDMIGMVESAVKSFNMKQLVTESVRRTFRKVDQDPWRDCRGEFIAHLDHLEEHSLYKTLVENQNGVNLEE